MRGSISGLLLVLVCLSAFAFSTQQLQKDQPHVFVIGAVHKPGVYTWQASLTVRDAITAAGGRLTSADPNTAFFLRSPDKKKLPAALNDRMQADDVLFIPPAPKAN